MLFICMLVLQMTGALLLLLNCSKGSKKAVIKNCFPGSNIAERDDNNNCTIPKEKLQESAHKIYLNITAFADLVVGYIIAAFSPIATYSTCYTVLGVAALTVILLVCEFYFSRLTARLVYSKDEEIQYSELEKNGVDTEITLAEIDATVNGTTESE